MKRIAVLLATLAAASSLILVQAGSVYACSCEEVAIEDAIGPDTSAAFVGRAISVVDVGYREGVDQLPLIWTFEVETVLDGDVTDFVEVGTGYDDGDCGVDFSERGRVGVVAQRHGPGLGLSTGLCGGVWGADQLIAVYGPGEEPLAATTAPEPIEPATSGPPFWFWVVAGLALILAAAGVVLARRGRELEDQEGWRNPPAT